MGVSWMKDGLGRCRFQGLNYLWVVALLLLRMTLLRGVVTLALLVVVLATAVVLVLRGGSVMRHCGGYAWNLLRTVMILQ